MGNKLIQREKIKTILVPTDFSASAKNALEYAAALAKKADAKIIILHIYQIPMVSGRGVPLGVHQVAAMENSKFADEQLRNLEFEVPALKNVEYETKAVPGYWYMEFPEIIETQHADLTIMGTKGASGLKEIILGSNTASVIGDALCPVLAIPGEARYKEIQHIGFAYDYASIKDLAMEPLVTLAKLFHADIKIFHVNESNRNKEDGKVVHEALLNQYLGTINHTYTNFHEEDIEEGINKYIREQNIGILAMIPRRHNLFYRLFNSSLTKKMAFHSKIPLLAIPE